MSYKWLIRNAPPGIRTPDPLIKSLESGHNDSAVTSTEQQAHGTEAKCTEAQQDLANKGHSESQISNQRHNIVRQEDSAVTEAEHRAAKLNHKQNNKRISQDRELASVINAWPSLPEPA